jgi:ATP-dependent Clp protease ATP-binding subunit ClpA
LLIENPLSQKLLAGEFVAGDKVSVSVKDEQLDFAKAYQH